MHHYVAFLQIGSHIHNIHEIIVLRAGRDVWIFERYVTICGGTISCLMLGNLIKIGNEGILSPFASQLC